MLTALSLLPPASAEAWSEGRIAAAYLIDFRDYFEVGLPITGLTLLLGLGWLVLVG